VEGSAGLDVVNLLCLEIGVYSLPILPKVSLSKAMLILVGEPRGSYS